MKKFISIITLLLGSVLNMTAQIKSNPSSPAKFITILQLGILEGQADKSYGQIQLVSGIQKNAWLYGIGAGIDYYGGKRSIPLFFDVRRDFKKGKKTPYLYADAGYNLSWLRDIEKVPFLTNGYKQSGGAYYEAGIGYKFLLKNKMALGFSAGYSVKQQKEIGNTFIFIDFPPFPQPSTNQQPDVYEYKFRRISLKFNCWF